MDGGARCILRSELEGPHGIPRAFEIVYKDLMEIFMNYSVDFTIDPDTKNINMEFFKHLVTELEKKQKERFS